MTKRVKILVADDEPNILALVCGVLQDENFDVISASNGEEAIQKAFKEKPDLMVLDVRMPLKNGFEVAEAVRANEATANTLIIILSALGDEAHKLTGFEKGADDYLTKPFSTEELKARIQALLKRSRGFPRGHTPLTAEENVVQQEKILTGIPSLDELLGGGLLKGANLLLFGSLGTGKSSFCRDFLLEGLKRNEKCLFVSLDEDLTHLRGNLNQSLNLPIQEYEKMNYARFVDAYSWASGNARQDEERFSISGVLNLSDLMDLIQRARQELGQNKDGQAGGRMVVDSLSSLLINFDLSAVLTFLTQLTRSASSIGHTTHFFTLEDGIVEEQAVNQVKFLMDGILELGEMDGKPSFRITRLKWQACRHDWIPMSAKLERAPSP